MFLFVTVLMTSWQLLPTYEIVATKDCFSPCETLRTAELDVRVTIMIDSISDSAHWQTSKRSSVMSKVEAKLSFRLIDPFLTIWSAFFERVLIYRCLWRMKLSLQILRILATLDYGEGISPEYDRSLWDRIKKLPEAIRLMRGVADLSQGWVPR